MTNFRKILTLGAMVMAIGATSITAFAAAELKTPADIAAGLTGKTVEAVIAERTETNKTYGTIANDAGKLEDFQKQMLENKKEILKSRVEAGIITQEQADTMLKAIEGNQALCDGTGTGSCGMGMGMGMGGGRGRGRGLGGCYLQ